MAKDTDKAEGLIPQQKARIAAKQAEIDALQAEVNNAIGELGRLRAEAERNPTPEVVSRADALSETVRRKRGQLPAPGRDPQPALGLELERARAELERLRAQRLGLARRIFELEEQQERWGPVVPEVLAAAQTIRGHLDRAGWPEGAGDPQAVAKLWSWAGRLKGDFDALPTLRQRLDSYGPDPGGPPLPDFELERKHARLQRYGLMRG